MIQAVGKTTKEMQREGQVGTGLFSLIGPMGVPSHIGELGKVVCVGGGLGVAPIFPQARAFKESGADVIGLAGFRSKEPMFWEEEVPKLLRRAHRLHRRRLIGPHGAGHQGHRAMKRHADIDEVIAIGPPVMMKACAETTRAKGIKTTVSLNPIMVGGTGMCGGCRVKVGEKIRFACVDGPDFDGHEVDLDDLMNRLRRHRGSARGQAPVCALMAHITDGAASAGMPAIAAFSSPRAWPGRGRRAGT